MQNRPSPDGLFCDCVFYENECSMWAFHFHILYYFFDRISSANRRICLFSTVKMTICTIFLNLFCAYFFHKCLKNSFWAILIFLHLTNDTKMMQCFFLFSLFTIWIIVGNIVLTMTQSCSLISTFEHSFYFLLKNTKIQNIIKLGKQIKQVEIVE